MATGRTKKATSRSLWSKKFYKMTDNSYSDMIDHFAIANKKLLDELMLNCDLKPIEIDIVINLNYKILKLIE